MKQAQLSLSMNEVDLPDLLFGPISYSSGHLVKLLRPSSTSRVESEEAINISPRIQETVFVLGSGEKIIITERKNYARPEGIDGVLERNSTGDLVWRNHRIIDEFQDQVDTVGFPAIIQNIASTWRDSFRFKGEADTIDGPGDLGLRPPQLGALFAVGCHWSLHQHPATIVMPTGTGKTETMLAVEVAYQIERLLVAVPSRALRTQTGNKFLRLGLLNELNTLGPGVETPVVGFLTSRPKSEEDLEFFRHCNVVVGTVSSLAGGTAEGFTSVYPTIFNSLIVDEAHHVKASTWETLRDPFAKQKVLQFSATPFRNDGKLVDGTIIYSYSLKAAQDDGYFKKIDFLPIHQLIDEQADEDIATAALARLRDDLAAGHDHLLLARCRDKERASEVFRLYERLAPDLNPVLIHSEIKDADERIAKLRAHDCQIAVCVNMLGEGVDIPSLKVAAVHDKHQSLAVLLQFVGRFARKGTSNLGTASVIANIADEKVALALEALYSEDADWNELLHEMSSSAAKEHAEFVRFLEASAPFEVAEDELPNVSHQSLRPKFSTLVYEAATFRPKRFVDGLPGRFELVRGWINDATNTLYFVTRLAEKPGWTGDKDVRQIEWDLFVLHHDPENKLLYLASSNKDSHFESIAKAVGASRQISGEVMFRSLGQIGRLVFNNLGVTKHGRRNLSYAMYTGADVKQALSETEKKGSRKSNISGYGWEDGKQITIGCSYRGRVWSKHSGHVPSFIRWAENQGRKIVDNSIDTRSIIANVLIPEYAETLPDYDILTVEWPLELLANSEDRITVLAKGYQFEWLDLSIEWQSIDRAQSRIDFTIAAGSEGDPIAEYTLEIKGEEGFDIAERTKTNPVIKIVTKEIPLTSFFNDYPPLFRFVDLSELDGNIILKAEDSGLAPLSADRLDAWDWSGTDITKESIWKNGQERRDSVQWAVAERLKEAGFQIVFDDDGRNEAADLVCIKEDDELIRLALVHCKFSGKSVKGGRVKDVVEVASQAVRSARWPGHFKGLVRHIQNRSRSRNVEADRALFLAGEQKDLVGILKASRFKEVRPKILIVQPGVSKSNITENQSVVLGAAAAYLKQTLNIDLDVICSP